MDNIIYQLETKGFVHIKDFILKNDIHDDLIDYLHNEPKNFDGVIYPIPAKYLDSVKISILDKLHKIADNINLKVSNSNNFICSIRVGSNKPSIKDLSPIKINTVSIHKDPKPTNGGALNWHIDHFPYFFFHDHKNWLITYIPIFKKDINSSNISLIPYDILQEKDMNSYNKIKHRGAMRFRLVEEDTIEWFKLRFPDESHISIGDWFAIDDYKDSSSGFKMTIDLEKYKITPLLNEYDLLLVRADVIHKTEDTNIYRISLRCDLIPKWLPQINSTLHWLLMLLYLPFVTKKVRYNYKNFMFKRISIFYNKIKRFLFGQNF